jgi:hypothetical protein
MARRRNTIVHRFARLKGLPPDEKALMMRIGALMDVALNNRQASNPFEPSRNQTDRVLYPPTRLLAETSAKSLKLTWDAPDSDIHLRYSIEIVNDDTGISVTKSSFTNYYTFKGDYGNYTAKVKSVGRNGASSILETITFKLASEFMSLEGAKNGPTEVGTLVQDHIKLLKGYHIYNWASVILDKYIAGERNNEVVFRLWSMPDENAVFSPHTATLHQTIVLYAATESGADLDGFARGGAITRAESIDGRNGSFETSQSVMFDPIPITTDWENTTRTFFLEATNRTIEDDEVNLSLTIWSGFAGVGDAVPSDPWDGGSSEIHGATNHNSWWPSMLGYYFRSAGVWLAHAVRHIWSVSQPGQGMIGNNWSYACWVRINHRNFSEQLAETPLDTEDRNAIANTNQIAYLYERRPMRGDDRQYGRIQITIDSRFNPPNPVMRHWVTVNVTDATDTQQIASFSHYAGVWNDGSLGQSTHQPWRADLDNRNNGWIFIVVCFEGGEVQADTAIPKLRVYMNIVPHDPQIEDQPAGFHINGMGCLRQMNDEGYPGGTAEQTDNSTGKRVFCNSDNKNLHTVGTLGTGLCRYTRPYGSGYIQAGSNNYFNRAGLWNVCIDSDSPPGLGESNRNRMDIPPIGPYGRTDSLVNGYPYPGIGQPPDPQYGWSWVYKYGDKIGEEMPDRQPHRENGTLAYINSLYNGGNGNVNWRNGTFGGNLVHYWLFGQIEEEFAIGSEVVRDIGNYRWGEDLNFCSEEPAIGEVAGEDKPRISEIAYPRETWVWRRHNAVYQSNYPDETYDQATMLAIGPGGGPSGESWSENTTINDIVSPDGANGTTQSDWTYPGKHL